MLQRVFINPLKTYSQVAAVDRAVNKMHERLAKARPDIDKVLFRFEIREIEIERNGKLIKRYFPVFYGVSAVENGVFFEFNVIA